MVNFYDFVKKETINSFTIDTYITLKYATIKIILYIRVFITKYKYIASHKLCIKTW